MTLNLYRYVIFVTTGGGPESVVADFGRLESAKRFTEQYWNVIPTRIAPRHWRAQVDGGDVQIRRYPGSGGPTLVEAR